MVAFVKGSRAEPKCGFSRGMMAALDQCGAAYETVDVLDEKYNPGVREAVKAYSAWPTLPQVGAHQSTF